MEKPASQSDFLCTILFLPPSFVPNILIYDTKKKLENFCLVLIFFLQSPANTDSLKMYQDLQEEMVTCILLVLLCTSY